MKTDRHGQAKILTSDEIARLLAEGFTCDRDRAHYSESACTLLTTDVYDPNGVTAKITICKGNTKGQQDTHLLEFFV